MPFRSSHRPVNACFRCQLTLIYVSYAHQEHKMRREDLERELALVDGWDAFFAFCRTGGAAGGRAYAGVATFCRRSVTVPVYAEEGFTGVLSTVTLPGAP